MKKIIILLLVCLLTLGSFTAGADISTLTVPEWVASASSIPASIQYIESEAFMNDTGITALAIPEGITEIGARAFAGCTSLKKIAVFNRNIVLGADALGTSGETKEIWAPSGSTAEAYAKAHGYTFVALAVDATDLLTYARSLLGIPYDSGSPRKYRLERNSSGQYIRLDCVFFVYACYYDVFGIKLPVSCVTMQSLTSQSVFRNQGLSAIKVTNPRDLQPGDIICWKNDSTSSCTHVGIYMGDGVFINASSSGGKVQTGNFEFSRQSSSYTPYYIRNFIHGWRIL